MTNTVPIGRSESTDIMPMPPPGSATAEIVALLEQMPSWAHLSSSHDTNASARERIAIETTMYNIAAYDLDAIRDAIGYYYALVDECGPLIQGDKRIAAYPVPDWDSRIFILNRFLFRLPKSVRRDSPHFRWFGGGWLGLPVSGETGTPKDSDEMDYRWPWTEDDSGKWHLTGSYAGVSGPMYRGDVAFDYFRKQFGRRTLVAKERTRDSDSGSTTRTSDGLTTKRTDNR